MPRNVDLNQLRDLLHTNQANGDTEPSAPRNTIVVDRSGQIRTGDSVDHGEHNQVSKVQQDTFHSPVPVSFSGAIRRAAEDLGAEVTACGPRVWQGVPLLAADLLLPGGIGLLILGADHFPGLPPLAFVTDRGETAQIQLEWNLGEDADTRLSGALRKHFQGSGPFRAVFGPGEVGVTSDAELAASAGWRKFYTSKVSQGIDPEAALHARSGGLLSNELTQKHVLIVGLGSGGSYVAEQLVRAGVGELTLIDPDTVEPANLSRTTYSWDDVGRSKTLSLASRLRLIRPDLKIHSHTGTLGSLDSGDLLRRARESDLMLALTDDPQAQSLLNQASYLSSTPAVFAALYAGAKGGEVILCIPDRTPCYRCATGGVRDMIGAAGDGNRDIDYGTGRLVAETALGVDIHHLDTATVKLSLSLLLHNVPGASLGDFAEGALRNGWSYLCLSMAPDYWFFPQVFGETSGQYAYQGVWLTPVPDPECPVCGGVEHRIDRLQAAPTFIDPSQFDNLP